MTGRALAAVLLLAGAGASAQTAPASAPAGAADGARGHVRGAGGRGGARAGHVRGPAGRRAQPLGRAVDRRCSPGAGLQPVRSDAVLAEYVGRARRRDVFDRSPPRAPVRLPLRAVVPGLAEALLGMRPGERRTVAIPPGLGYGARGVPARDGGWRVPPHAVLLFDVTLVRVAR